MKKKSLFVLTAFVICLNNSFLQAQLSVNTAVNAAASAHYSAGWSPLSNINDGILGSNNAAWGSWSDNRPETGWVVYEWTTKRAICKSVVYFCPDRNETTGWGDNCPVPESWKIQYWDENAGGWADVTLLNGQQYTRNFTVNTGNVPNEVTFNTVNTHKIRLFLEAQTNGTTNSAFRISEWEVYTEFDYETASPDQPVNMTALINNPSFESAFTGWANSGMTIQSNTFFPIKMEIIMQNVG